MKQKLIELYGIDRQPESIQEKAISAFDKLVHESGNPDESANLRIFLHSLGVHQLNESILNEMRDKTCAIIEHLRNNTAIPASMFKWHSYAESPKMVNEVNKSDFRWQKDETVRLDGNKNKIKKSDYKWGQSGSYGSIQEAK